MQSTPFLLALSTAVAVAATADSQSVTPLKPLPAIQLEALASVPGLDGPRFSLGFSEATPIRDVLLLVVRGTRFSVVPDPSIDQRFTGELKNVTLREALDLIVEPAGLDYTVRGQVIRVHRRELETRFYNIDHVITQRSGRRSVGGATGVASTDAPDVFTDLADAVRTLLSSEGRMHIDRTAALLQVTDRPSRLAKVEQYIETAMLRVMRQVQIEAMIVEIDLPDGAVGLDWKAIVNALPRPDGSAVTSGSTLTIPSSAVPALLTSLAGRGTMSVLANPLMTAMNNEPAVVRVSTQPLETPSEAMSLSITPQISTDGVIHMSVSASLAGQAVVREADNVYRLREGETILITGLALQRAGRRGDVVILLTPTILHTRTVA